MTTTTKMNENKPITLLKACSNLLNKQKSRKTAQMEELDTEIIMNTEQPDTIIIAGVQIPSWYFVWRKQMELKTNIERLEVTIRVMISIFILSIGIELLLTP